MRSEYITFALVGLIGLSISTWITPQRAKLETNRQELTTLQQELKSLTGNLVAVDDSKDLLELDIEVLKTAIPQGFDQDNLITIIKDTAEENKLELTNISFSQSIAEQSNQIKSTKINLNITGNPTQIESFLKSIENSSRGFIVTSFGLNNGTLNEIDVTTLNITLEAYYS
jgi:Tfp pilus assembly protein PilO